MNAGIIYLQINNRFNNILSNHHNLSSSHRGIYLDNKYIITHIYDDISNNWLGPYNFDILLNNHIICNIKDDKLIDNHEKCDDTEELVVSKIVLAEILHMDNYIRSILSHFIDNINYGRMPRIKFRRLINDIKFHSKMSIQELFPNKEYIYDNIIENKTNYNIELSFSDLVYIKNVIKDMDDRIQDNMLWSVNKDFNNITKDYNNILKYISECNKTKKINFSDIPILDNEFIYIEYCDIRDYRKLKLDDMSMLILKETKINKIINILNDLLVSINNDIINNKTPVIDYKKLINIYNSLASMTNNQIINYVEYQLSITSSILLPSSMEYKQIDIELIPGEKILLSVINPSLDRFTNDQLKEILLYLNGIENDKNINDLRVKIIKKLTKN